MTIYIGTSGWSYDDWVNQFYPEDIERKEWLQYLSQHFNTVELNMSFYRFPFKNMLKGWYKRLPENFHMTMKANRKITHNKKFKEVGELIERFYSLMDRLKEKQGCVLFQVPPSFNNTDKNRRRIENFCQNVDDNHRNVIEFRDDSWWKKEIYTLLQKNGVEFCTVSGLGMPEDVVVTGRVAYFRFHGPGEAYSSLYSEKEIEEWADRIKETQKEKQIEDIYCYFNNDKNGYAIKNAKQLQNFLDL